MMLLNPSNGGIDEEKEKKKKKKKAKVVVVMGPTGTGKSKLAVDLASLFPIEIINADSMQVYLGLDVLTNKVPLDEQKGVPHHLLGTVSPNMEFTAKDFRDFAIPLIEEILSRNHLPVLVGGTNNYIQAVVSRFLLDDSTEDADESCSNDALGDNLHTDINYLSGRDDIGHGYGLLKELDPVAANRIHPNNHRKINQYLSLYTCRGILPSKLFQGKAAEVVPVLDQFVGERVDCMVDAGLLDELYDIYKPGADYTRGLRQAIGVREFEDFLKIYLSDRSTDEIVGSAKAPERLVSEIKDDKFMKENLRDILNLPREHKLRILLDEAIDKVKLNTRRLLRRQKRRVNRLQTLFRWNIHYVDATESISSTLFLYTPKHQAPRRINSNVLLSIFPGKSEETWAAQVVKSASEIVQSFLTKETSVPDSTRLENHLGKSIQRDLWTQYVCKACGDKVLRGSHEWEQHKQGRAHRKRTSRLKKAQDFKNVGKQDELIPPQPLFTST